MKSLYPDGLGFRPATLLCGAGHAGARAGPGLEATGRDGLTAGDAHAVGAGRDPLEGLVDLGEMPLDLPDQRVDLGTLEGDRRPLDVVLVIGVGVPGGLHDAGEVTPQAREPGGDDIALGVQARRGVVERAQRRACTVWRADVPARLPLTAGTVTTYLLNVRGASGTSMR
jgi:hypothetical protein